MREVLWQALEYNVEYYIQSRVKQVMQENGDDDLLLPEKISGMAIGTYKRTTTNADTTPLCVFTNVRTIKGAKLPSGIGHRQLEWFANVKQYKFYYPEIVEIKNRHETRTFRQLNLETFIPSHLVKLTNSFMLDETDSPDGSSVSMQGNRDRSYNAELDSNHKKYSDHYDIDDDAGTKKKKKKHLKSNKTLKKNKGKKKKKTK